MSEDRKQQTEIENIPNYWLHASRSIKVMGINAVFVVPLLVLLFYPRWSIFFILIFSIVILAVLEKFGYTPTVALRMIKVFFTGSTIKRTRRVGKMRIWK